MIWPGYEHIKCVGFSKNLLPIIFNAVDSEQFHWIGYHALADVGVAKFRWFDCEWEITEYMEVVGMIELISGDINNQDLTALVLKG